MSATLTIRADELINYDPETTALVTGAYGAFPLTFTEARISQFHRGAVSVETELGTLLIGPDSTIKITTEISELVTYYLVLFGHDEGYTTTLHPTYDAALAYAYRDIVTDSWGDLDPWDDIGATPPADHLEAVEIYREKHPVNTIEIEPLTFHRD